ncbi:MAG: purine-nucleoside phosphorylase, partial [Actinobacteria bacterium]|nr:purine-nucleoside phosphorylase [Actinomycetota bacterium]
QESAAYLRESLPQIPRVGIILGSGLGSIASEINDSISLPYASVPYMRTSTAPGHSGRFVCGTLNGVYVICMQGRLHAYEGYSASDVAYPIQVMKELGIEALILTNASGGINTSYAVGDIMVISDHINFTGLNPLVGPNDDEVGPRSHDMSHAYSPRLRELAKQAAYQQGIHLQEGVYIGCLGPSFETPAEIRAFRILGADAVGMSTVFEVIAATHCGLPVLAFSLITNMAAGIVADDTITMEEVADIGGRKAVQVCALVRDIVGEL